MASSPITPWQIDGETMAGKNTEVANKARVNILSWKGAQVLTFLVFIAAKYLSFAWLMAQEKCIHKFYNQAQKGFQPPSEL